MTGKFLFQALIWLRKTSIITFSRHSFFYPHPSYGRHNLIISRRTLSESYIFTSIKGFGIGLLLTMGHDHSDFLPCFTAWSVGIADLD